MVKADSAESVKVVESTKRKEVVRVSAHLVFPKNGDLRSANRGSDS